MIVLENITLYSLFTRNEVHNNDEVGEKNTSILPSGKDNDGSDFLIRSSAIARIVCDRRGSIKPGLDTHDCPDRPNLSNQTRDIPDRPIRLEGFGPSERLYGNQALPYDRPDRLSTIWSHRGNCMETRLKERIA